MTKLIAVSSLTNLTLIYLVFSKQLFMADK